MFLSKRENLGNFQKCTTRTVRVTSHAKSVGRNLSVVQGLLGPSLDGNGYCPALFLFITTVQGQSVLNKQIIMRNEHREYIIQNLSAGPKRHGVEVIIKYNEDQNTLVYNIFDPEFIDTVISLTKIQTIRPSFADEQISKFKDGIIEGFFTRGIKTHPAGHYFLAGIYTIRYLISGKPMFSIHLNTNHFTNPPQYNPFWSVRRDSNNLQISF